MLEWLAKWNLSPFPGLETLLAIDAEFPLTMGLSPIVANRAINKTGV
ncbi:MAG: hypothetical protein ACFB21_07935 [Opitutales bacterium]